MIYHHMHISHPQNTSDTRQSVAPPIDRGVGFVVTALALLGSYQGVLKTRLGEETFRQGQPRSEFENAVRLCLDSGVIEYSEAEQPLLKLTEAGRIVQKQLEYECRKRLYAPPTATYVSLYP